MTVLDELRKKAALELKRMTGVKKYRAKRESLRRRQKADAKARKQKH